MMTPQLGKYSFSFSHSHNKQILDLAKHREPGFPSFLTLELTPDEGETGWATMWYVGRTDESDGRYHVQFAGESELLSATLKDDKLVIK